MKRIYNYRTNKLYEFESAEEIKNESNKIDFNRVNESEDEDVVTFKLCVREEPLNDDVEVDDDVTFEDEYESMEDALVDAEDAMRQACESEGFDFDDDCEELDCDDCEDCRVFENPDKRYIFVTCPIDEEPNFDLEIEDDEIERDFDDESDDEYEDIPLDDADDFEGEFEDERTDESVATRFSRLCNLFESEGEEDETEEENDADDSEDEDGADESGDDAETDKDGEGEEESSDEDEEMKAVAITVKTDDVDACKEELVDAGVAEDDIEVMDDKDGETEIRIDVNSVMELKDYLAKKGIDLEEEIGGEIVSDEDGSEEDADGADDEETDPDAEEDVPEYDLDDLGDIFGAEEGE